MISSKFIAYVKSVRALRKFHLLGFPLVPKRLVKLAPFNRELYNSFLVEAAAWMLPPNPVIYDVGANNGDFALAFQQVYPGARITLFEPLARHVHRLENLKTDGRYPWTILPVALGSKDEELEIEVPEGKEDASSLHGFCEEYLKHNPGAGKTTRQLCKVRRLDALVESSSEPIDLVKIDVEGFEFEVIDGATSTLMRARNVVVEVSRLRHAGEPGCPVERMVRRMAVFGLGLFRMEATIINRNIDPRPLEYDLYFSRHGKSNS